MLDSPAYWITWSKKLQDQAGMLGVPTIKGRGNFPCDRGAREGLDSCEFKFCDDDDPENENPGKYAPDCPFIQQFKRGADAELTALNYALFLQYMYHPKRPLPWRPWLIADEGDVLEDALAGYMDVYLDRVWFENIEFPVELPANGKDEDRLAAWTRRALDEEILHQAEGSKQYLEWKKAQDMAKQAEGALQQQYIVDDTGLVISLRVVWPLKYAKMLLNRFKHVLIMSATLGDIKAMAGEMGLPDSTWSSLAVPSAIPVSRRLIYYSPVANLRHDCTELDYISMADAIIGWGREDYPRDRGIIHVSSYKHARRLGQLLFSRGLGQRVHIQDRPGPTVQQKWEASPDGVLVSPVAGLGLDLPYVFPWQVVAKLPYPGLGDKIVRLRLHQNAS
jgi:Rad3-related DNA helicase